MGTGKLLGQPNKMLGVTCDGLASHPVEDPQNTIYCPQGLDTDSNKFIAYTIHVEI